MIAVKSFSLYRLNYPVVLIINLVVLFPVNESKHCLSAVDFHDVFFLNPDIPCILSPRSGNSRFHSSLILRLDKCFRYCHIGKIHMLRCCYSPHSVSQILISSDTVLKSLFVHHNLMVSTLISLIKKTNGFKLFYYIFRLLVVNAEILFYSIHIDCLLLHCIHADFLNQPVHQHIGSCTLR